MVSVSVLPGNKEDLYLEVNKDQGCGCKDGLGVQKAKETVGHTAVPEGKMVH